MILQSCCQAYVFPSMFSLANVYEAFTTDGRLQDKKLEQMLAKNIAGFMDFIQKLR